MAECGVISSWTSTPGGTAAFSACTHSAGLFGSFGKAKSPIVVIVGTSIQSFIPERLQWLRPYN